MKFFNILLAVLLISTIGYSQSNPSLPITFEEDAATVDYALRDFGDIGGNQVPSEIVVDPTDANNSVVKYVKPMGSETWAGSVVADNGLTAAIPFTASEQKIYVRVWSPDANIPVRLKVENTADGSIAAEVEATVTTASTWETLEFDLSNSLTNPVDLNQSYDKIVIFFDFGTSGADKTYYWDDVAFANPVSTDVVLNENTFEVFPNPAAEQFTINFEEAISTSANLSIFDLQGKLVKQELLTNQQTVIATDDLKNGLYIIRVDNGDKSYVHKLSVVK